MDHFRCNISCGLIRGRIWSLGHSGCPLDEPAGGRASNVKGIGSIGHGPKLDPEGRVLFVNFGRLIVKVFTELGHVDSERTKGLTNGGAGLGGWTRNRNRDGWKDRNVYSSAIVFLRMQEREEEEEEEEEEKCEI